MKCPICGTSVPLSSDRCPDCGFRCGNGRSQTAPSSAPGTPPETWQPPKRSRRGCCCAAALLIPLLVLVLLLFLGIGQLFAAEVLPETGFFGDFPAMEAPVQSLPAEAAGGCFSIRDGAVTFLPEAWEDGAVLRVPELVDGQTVTAIAPGCFSGCDMLTTIVLPETVTAIGDGAFSGCTALRGLLVPEGTRTIGEGAFDGCVNLESVSVPASVTAIAPGCMDDCASLMYIFYDGSFESWNALYSDFITPFTAAVCTDGAYYHGAAG